MGPPDRHEYLISVLAELRRLPKETEWVEFKHNHDDPVEIGEYISALSNSAAIRRRPNAYIVWGIADATHELVGTSFDPKRAKKGNEELENWLLRLLNPRLHLRLFALEVEGKPISMIEIPCATHQPVQFQGFEYIRVGSYKKKLKDFPEKERALWGIFASTPFEEQVAAERVSPAEVLALLDHAAYFKLLNIEAPDSIEGVLSRLAADSMIARSDVGGWNILNLGAILLASDFTTFHHFARKAVRVIEYDGDGRVRTKRERVGGKGYAVGFEGLIRFLKGILPENEVIGEALRKTVPMYPELAIRELVANLIVHQDFTASGTGPMIEVFDSRLEITNPGEPLVEPLRFLDSPPRSRNEALASFLRRVGICEERGSGVDKVVFETELYQLPAPLFDAEVGHTRATLFAHRSFSEMDRNDRVRACYLHACLQCVQRKVLTNSSLRTRFGIEEKNRAQVSRVIGDTVDARLIRPRDPESESRKHASYVPYWA